MTTLDYAICYETEIRARVRRRLLLKTLAAVTFAAWPLAALALLLAR